MKMIPKRNVKIYIYIYIYIKNHQTNKKIKQKGRHFC